MIHYGELVLRAFSPGLEDALIPAAILFTALAEFKPRSGSFLGQNGQPERNQSDWERRA